MNNKKNRPFVLSIAGFDPCAGAGILADIKTFEQLNVYGLGAATSTTFQTEDRFYGVEWICTKLIIKQIKPLLKKYKIKVFKIGLIKNLKTLLKITGYIRKKSPDTLIIWDPIIRASAGFEIHNSIDHKLLKACLKNINIITPNWNEAMMLSKNDDAIKGAEMLSEKNVIFLKGGHSIETPATDILFIKNHIEIFHSEYITELEKHGTGCVLSSALAAYLALEYNLSEACRLAKKYTLDYLVSNEGKLGWHR
jgi:hydroxymethylpyrimidine/phosphomethylpyrimidine kinase